jgi:putative ubiquitin-RnfH superfamily antitoxin RatB of RatAB toxin-antitoxin module
MAAEARFSIEIVYALPDAQEVIALEVAPGTTVGEAIALCGAAHRYGIDVSAVPAGIYGQRVSADTVLREGDRVEIYRALTADPKQARRRRAARET